MGWDPVPAGERDERETDGGFGARRVFWLRPKGQERRVEHDAEGKDQHDSPMNHINEAGGR